MSEDFDAIVIGAGAVGLSIARALSKSKKKVLLVEKNTIVGSGISSRNSEVIHAGIYYQKNSLKSKFCVNGKKLLIDFCSENNIPFQLVGKLIVANNKYEVDSLLEIYKKGINNGVSDLEILDKNDIQLCEPELRAEKAILSPKTGILDSHSFMISLLSDFEKNGGEYVKLIPSLNDNDDWVQNFAEYLTEKEDDEFAGSDPKAGSTIQGTGFNWKPKAKK